jgi:hypothetical protein
MNKGASSCVFCRRGSCRAYKTRKNWHMLGDFLHIQPCIEKSAQCAKMTTGITGQKTCILRTDEKYHVTWHHWAGKR